MALPVGVPQMGTFKGAKGDKGDTGTFASASAVSVPAGQPATVVMSGPETARHAAFEIPRGLPGVNAVENDEAVAEYVAAVDSATRSALAAEFTPRNGVVLLDDYYLPGDAGDWNLALARAIAAVDGQDIAIRLSRMYPYKTSITVETAARIEGNGQDTGFYFDRDSGTPVRWVTFSAADGTTLNNFYVDGGVRSGDPDVETTERLVNFVNCVRVNVSNMTVGYASDWALTFNGCSHVRVTDHTHIGGGLGFPGGRDGVHFMDTSYALLDGARIESGDDCVSVTCANGTTSYVTIRNVSGRSQIAAVVTVGFENESEATPRAINNITIENITTIGDATPPYIVKVLSGHANIFSNVSVRNVTGGASSHAVYVSGTSTQPIKNVTVANVMVTSTGGHGVYLQRVEFLHLSDLYVRGSGAAYDGVNLLNCSRGTVTMTARAAGLWGLQLNSCNSISVLGVAAYDCGTGGFATNTGGGIRLNSVNRVIIANANIYGGTGNTYYGLSQASATAVTIGASMVVGATVSGF